MKKTNKIAFVASLLVSFTLLLEGCKTDILSDDGDPTSTAKNVRVRVFAYVNGYLLNTDSLYFLGGANVKFDDISIIHSNYYFVDMGDTLKPGDAGEWRFTNGDPNVFLYQLPPGSYSGFYRYLVGLDSLSNSRAPKDQPSGSPLNSDNYRGQGKGYNFVTIKGRIQDPNKPNSEPDIPMKWVLSTTQLNMEFGMGKSFNLVTGKPATFDVVFDVEKLFTGLAPLGTPMIEADPSNPNDFGNAETLRQNFIQAYNIQL